jgi:SAM-dependent methyltransferase
VDGAVDRVMTVNTVYFWSDLRLAFREVHRVLTPGGRLLVAVRDMAVMHRLDPTVFTLRSPDEVAAAIADAGFAEIAVETPPDAKTHLIVATR